MFHWFQTYPATKGRFFRLKIVLLWKKICKYKPISCTSVTSPPLGPFNIQAANCINYHSKTSVRQELLSCSLMQVTIFNSSTQQPQYISTHKHGAQVFPKKRTWNLIWGVAEFSCVITFHMISMTFLPTWTSSLLGLLRNLKNHQGAQSPKFRNWAPSRCFSVSGRHRPESVGPSVGPGKFATKNHQEIYGELANWLTEMIYYVFYCKHLLHLSVISTSEFPV